MPKMEKMTCQSCGDTHMMDVSGPIFSEWIAEHAEEIGTKSNGKMPLMTDVEFPRELLEGVVFRPFTLEFCTSCSEIAIVGYGPQIS